MWRKGNPRALLMEMYIGAATMEKSMEVCKKKIRLRTTIRSNNFTSGYFSEENKNTNSKRYIPPYVHCNIIYSRQDMEAT